MANKGQAIVARALEILQSEPDGMRYHKMVEALARDFPEMKIATIRSSIWNIHTKRPEAVYKPGLGLFRHTKFKSHGELSAQ